MEQQVFYEHQDLLNKYTDELKKEIDYNRSFINSLIKHNSEINKSINILQTTEKDNQQYVDFIKWKISLPWYKTIFRTDNKLFKIFKDGI